MRRNHLTALFSQWFAPIGDGTVNGLQFEGKEEIRSMAFAVDVSLESIEAAVSAKADALFTHHGLIWGGLKAVGGIDKKRLALLFSSDLNLYTYHLPLDIHPELGNNAQLIEALGLERSAEPFFEVGYFAHCSMPYPELIQRLRRCTGSGIVEMPFGPKLLKRIALCTGGAGTVPALFEAIGGGADTLLTGETSSLLYHYAREAGINVLCAGHYATETLGVKAVQRRVQELGVETLFLDLPTGW